jgi:transposase-like protein
VADGLKGLPEAFEAVLPATTLQTCIVHLIRNSLDFASWRTAKAWQRRSSRSTPPPAPKPLRRRWRPLRPAPGGSAFQPSPPFFALPPEVRRIIYTTNAIESVHARLRKIIKTRGHFPSDEADTKLIWLALRNITADWTRPTREWKAAMNQFAILYEDRFTLARQ